MLASPILPLCKQTLEVKCPEQGYATGNRQPQELNFVVRPKSWSCRSPFTHMPGEHGSSSSGEGQLTSVSSEIPARAVSWGGGWIDCFQLYKLGLGVHPSRWTVVSLGGGRPPSCAALQRRPDPVVGRTGNVLHHAGSEWDPLTFWLVWKLGTVAPC